MADFGMADFESPSGGKLPGTATHWHTCLTCCRLVPCGEPCGSEANGTGWKQWRTCCVCEINTKPKVGSVILTRNQSLFTRESVVVNERTLWCNLPVSEARWIAHELAKEMLRQAGIDPAKGRW